jgi:hypothetical protein
MGKMNKIITVTFIALIAIFSGIMITAQVLGFLNFYAPVAVYSLSIILTGVFGILLIKHTSQFILASMDNPDRLASNKWIRRIVFGAGIVLFVIVLFLPLLLWPFSGISHELNWDAGFYHFTKAAELVVSHSSWDLTIPYGEYPFGFESLIAESLLLNSSGYLIGAIHALIVLFFTLSLFLLISRYTRLQSEYIFFITVAIIASYDIIRFVNLNPFQIFRVLAFTIGKNDFFLTALMMAFIYFSPVAPEFPKRNLWGMGVVSALVCCTKPYGVLPLIFIWMVVLVMQIQQWKKDRKVSRADLGKWLGIILLHTVSLLWAVRNLIEQGRLFSDASLEIQQTSILQNITNPLFYRSLGMIPLMIVLVLVVSFVAAIFMKRVHISIPVLYSVLIVTFMITPATLYFGANGGEEAIIFWRLGFYLLVFLIPIIFVILDPVLVKIFLPGNKVLHWLMAAGLTVLSLGASIQNYSRIIPDRANAIVLQDQYAEPVGVDGYRSAYDYIRRNVSHSVVWVENGLPFLIYGDPLTNSSTRLRPADYQVFLQTNWNGTAGYPEYINSAEWKAQWEEVYADGEGRVFKRRN